MKALPPSRPKANRSTVEEAALKVWRAAGKEGSLPPFYLFGCRAYYKDTMGARGKNDRGIYDDAILVVGPETFIGFNANVDPSIYRPKIATLKPGVHRYRKGNHGISRPGGGYPAFRPATKNEELPVTRDGVAVPWPGVAINIHRGGRSTTSSEGCQTIPPDQWGLFYDVVSNEMKKNGVREFDYILHDGPIA
jgi:lysozyme